MFRKTDDGFESDSSFTSITSISSNLSTRSTPAEFHKNKRFPTSRGTSMVHAGYLFSIFFLKIQSSEILILCLGKNRGANRRDFHRKPNAAPPTEKLVENRVDNLKKAIYPTQKEARIRKLDVCAITF